MVIDHSQYRSDQVRIQWHLGSSTKELEPGQRDQDAYTRMTLRRILQPRYVIFEAEDESEALQQVHARHPNLVILDFHLPEVNVRKLSASGRRA